MAEERHPCASLRRGGVRTGRATAESCLSGDKALERLAAVSADAGVRSCLSNPRLTSAQLVQLLVEGSGTTLDAEQGKLAACAG